MPKKLVKVSFLDKWCPPIEAGDIKKGDIILLKGRPVKITNISVSK